MLFIDGLQLRETTKNDSSAVNIDELVYKLNHEVVDFETVQIGLL